MSNNASSGVASRRAVMLGVLAGLSALQVRAADKGIAGTWSGLLTVGSQALHLRFEFASDGSGSMFSVDQDNRPIAAGMTTSGDAVVIAVKKIRAKFEGRVNPAGELVGTWHQSGLDTPLLLLRGDAGLGLTPPALEPLTQLELELMRAQSSAPALGAAAENRGSAARFWVTGERAINSKVPVTVDDQWHLGSITKSITATLVGRLVDAGSISWDDTVGALLASVAPDMRSAYREVTLRHLLTHRAGLPGDLPLPMFATFEATDAGDVRASRRRYARHALKMKPVGPKGTTFEYSNNGYVLVGAMLEAKLGSTWEELVARHVFAPLNLASAGFGAPGKTFGLTQPLGHLADLDSYLLHLVGGSGLKAVHAGLGESDNPRVIGPAGTGHMDLRDVLRYLAAHRDTTDFLAPETWRELHTPPFGGSYAMGWFVKPDGSLWHNGSNNRWYAEVMFNSKSGIAAVAVTNEARNPAKLAVGRAAMQAANAGAG